MPPMIAVEEIPLFLEQERLIRQENRFEVAEISEYWAELLEVLKLYRSLQLGKISPDGKRYDARYAEVMRPMIRRYNAGRGD